MRDVSTGASSIESALPVAAPENDSNPSCRNAYTDWIDRTAPVNAPTSNTIGRLPKPMYSAASR